MSLEVRRHFLEKVIFELLAEDDKQEVRLGRWWTRFPGRGNSMGEGPEYSWIERMR